MEVLCRGKKYYVNFHNNVLFICSRIIQTWLRTSNIIPWYESYVFIFLPHFLFLSYLESNIDLKCVLMACSDWMRETSFAYPQKTTDVIILSLCPGNVTRTVAKKVRTFTLQNPKQIMAICLHRSYAFHLTTSYVGHNNRTFMHDTVIKKRICFENTPFLPYSYQSRSEFLLLQVHRQGTQM